MNAQEAFKHDPSSRMRLRQRLIGRVRKPGCIYACSIVSNGAPRSVPNTARARSRCRTEKPLPSEKYPCEGIITDGDLRRHISGSNSILERTAATVMTREPVTIGRTTLAIE